MVMKKAFLACIILVACAVTVKAQDTSLRYYQPRTLTVLNASTLKIDTSVNALTGKKADLKSQYNSLLQNKINEATPVSTRFDEVYYSTMPVVGNNRKRTDIMPIIRPGERNTHYTMNIKRIDIVEINKKKAAEPEGK
jgi:hypothetical protein